MTAPSPLPDIVDEIDALLRQRARRRDVTPTLDCTIAALAPALVARVRELEEASRRPATERNAVVKEAMRITALAARKYPALSNVSRLAVMEEMLREIEDAANDGRIGPYAALGRISSLASAALKAAP